VTKHAAVVSGAQSLNDRDRERRGAAGLDELRDRVPVNFAGNGLGYRRGQPKTSQLAHAPRVHRVWLGIFPLARWCCGCSGPSHCVAPFSHQDCRRRSRATVAVPGAFALPLPANPLVNRARPGITRPSKSARVDNVSWAR